MSKLLGALSEPEFQVCLRKTNQAGFGIVKRFAIDIEVIVVISCTDPMGILTLKSDIAREKEAFGIPKGLGVGGVRGEFVLCELFDMSSRIYADSIVRIRC